MRGVGPADRTGKSLTTCWPGGTREELTSVRRLPLNPRDMNGMGRKPNRRVNPGAVGPRPATTSDRNNPERLAPAGSTGDQRTPRILLTKAVPRTNQTTAPAKTSLKPRKFPEAL